MTYDEARNAHNAALRLLVDVDVTADTGLSRLAALEMLRVTLIAEINQIISAAESTALVVREVSR